MQRLAREELERLRARIARIEKRPALAGSDRGIPQKASSPSPLATPPGLLHEVFTDDLRNSGAVLGFALGQARALLTPERPAVLFLQLVQEAQETGLPYGAGLAHFGIGPKSLVIGRMQSITDLLWALEEAVCCPPVAAALADIGGHPKALDFTASRRLSLRAAGAGSSVFLLRYGREREASAARLRWRVQPALSGERPFDPRAPAGPRFAVTLEKGRLGAAGAVSPPGTEFLLDWTGHGFLVVESDGGEKAAAAALSRAVPAALGHGLSQAG